MRPDFAGKAFYGAEHLWPGMTWDTIPEAVRHIRSAEEVPQRTRQYHRDKLFELGYDLHNMVLKFNEVINA